MGVHKKHHILFTLNIFLSFEYHQCVNSKLFNSIQNVTPYVSFIRIQGPSYSSIFVTESSSPFEEELFNKANKTVLCWGFFMPLILKSALALTCIVLS